MKALPILVSLLFLVLIYSTIDLAQFLDSFQTLHALWLVLAFACFVPQTALSGIRWQQILRAACPLGFWEAVRQILASNTLNLFLPSKMGDLAKGYFLSRRAPVPLKTGLFLAVGEKLLDMGGLCTILLAANLWRGVTTEPLVLAALLWSVGLVAGLTFGLALPFPRRLMRLLPAKVSGLVPAWEEARGMWNRHPGRLAAVLGMTVGLWVLHLLQIHLFFFSVGSHPPVVNVYAFVPVAILVGLLPISLAGFGTRDAALIYLFSADDAPAVLASVGLLTGSRYIVPALAGLLFLPLALQARQALREQKETPGLRPILR
ncbi:MAG: lysylphosphatidylglycerol synthase transmembrane domain-containing protein [Candidatus Methylomirabilia bacterium]